MRVQTIISFLVAAAILSCALASEQESLDVPDFVPTTEFQRILPGQKIPPGLHVRIDFSTGERWAKLNEVEQKPEAALPADSSSDRAVTVVKEEEENQPSSSPSSSPSADLETVRNRMNLSKEEFDDLLDKFIPFQSQEVKQLGNALNMLRNASSTAAQALDALETIEEIVHDHEHSTAFTNQMNGMKTLLAIIAGEHHHSQDIGVVTQAAWALGTAVQNNPAVQTRVLSLGGSSSLLTAFAKRVTVARRTRSEDKAEVHWSCASKLLYALSALLRGQPEAQRDFVKLNGFQTTRVALMAGVAPLPKRDTAALSSSSSSASPQQGSDDSSDSQTRSVITKGQWRIRTKILQLWGDLMREHEGKCELGKEKEAVERLAITAPVANTLRDQHFCVAYARLYHDSNYADPSTGLLGEPEPYIDALVYLSSAVAKPCGNTWRNHAFFFETLTRIYEQTKKQVGPQAADQQRPSHQPEKQRNEEEEEEDVPNEGGTMLEDEEPLRRRLEAVDRVKIAAWLGTKAIARSDIELCEWTINLRKSMFGAGGAQEAANNAGNSP